MDRSAGSPKEDDKQTVNIKQGNQKCSFNIFLFHDYNAVGDTVAS